MVAVWRFREHVQVYETIVFPFWKKSERIAIIDLWTGGNASTINFLYNVSFRVRELWNRDGPLLL